MPDTEWAQQRCHARNDCTQLDKWGHLPAHQLLEEMSHIMEAPSIGTLSVPQSLYCVGLSCFSNCIA